MSVVEHLAPAATAVEPEDAARAGLYALLGRLFYGPPGEDMLVLLASDHGICGEGEDSAFCSAWRALKQAAAGEPPEALRQQYDDIFIGVGASEVMLYGSYYLTGFMMEEPVAELRSDLARRGLGRRSGASESEDHVSALCDAMRALIEGGASRPPAGLGEQAEFFDRHLRPWYGKLGAALQKLDKAPFYKALGGVMQTFFDIEAQAFDFV